MKAICLMKVLKTQMNPYPSCNSFQDRIVLQQTRLVWKPPGFYCPDPKGLETHALDAHMARSVCSALRGARCVRAGGIPRRPVSDPAWRMSPGSLLLASSAECVPKRSPLRKTPGSHMTRPQLLLPRTLQPSVPTESSCSFQQPEVLP